MVKWTECYSKHVGMYEALSLDDEYLGDLYLVAGKSEKSELTYLFVGGKKSRYLLGDCREYINADSLEEAKQRAVDLVIHFLDYRVFKLNQTATEYKEQVIKLIFAQKKQNNAG